MCSFCAIANLLLSFVCSFFAISNLLLSFVCSFFTISNLLWSFVHSPDIQRVNRELCAMTPMDKLDDRRAELRQSLARITRLKREMDAQSK